MKYHELIELYRKKELPPETYEQIARDIERHEAISEYLFDREEQDFSFEKNNLDSNKNGSLDLEINREKNTVSTNTPDEFTRRINRAIRRAFIKLGCSVVAVTLALVLFILFLLPELISLLYYDPGRVIGTSEYGTDTTQMSLDTAVYSELMLPGNYRYQVQSESRGYGNYDLTICQNVSYTGQMNHIAGRLERGKLKLYDVNQFQPVTGNAFGWFQISSNPGERLSDLTAKEDSYFFCAAGDRDQATETLKSLDDNRLYTAYVTLDQMMDYPDFLAFVDKNEALDCVWCAPCTSDPSDKNSIFVPDNLGFFLNSGVSGIDLKWDETAYPDLVLWSDSDYEKMENAIRKEDFAAGHFSIMLDYMADQETFLQMMNHNPETFRNAADYVRENGLTVYGFAAMMKKEDILRLNDQEEVYEIYAQELH